MCARGGGPKGGSGLHTLCPSTPLNVLLLPHIIPPTHTPHPPPCKQGAWGCPLLLCSLQAPGPGRGGPPSKHDRSRRTASLHGSQKMRNLADPRTQGTTQAQSLPPTPSCFLHLGPSCGLLPRPLPFHPLPLLPGLPISPPPCPAGPSKGTFPPWRCVCVCARALWDGNRLARVKGRGGWGAGSRLGALDIGPSRGREPRDWTVRLASLSLSEREDVGSGWSQG